MSERRPRVGVTRRLPSAVEVLLRQRYDVVQHESPGPLDAMALVAMMREVARVPDLDQPHESRHQQAEARDGAES